MSYRGMGSLLASEGQFRDRYRVFRAADAVTLDICYDGKGRVTAVELGAATASIALFSEALAAIEELPAELLRPRFANRPRSSLALLAEQTARLEGAGLRVAGRRMAQFELAYDIEDAGPPTAEPPVKLIVCYDRRGDVTWHRVVPATGSPIAERALEALGLPPALAVSGRPAG
jgi:hypothetical protein